MYKIKEKNGFRYSLGSFNGYKYRVRIVAESDKGNQLLNTDIYTDNTDKEEVQRLLENSAIEKFNIERNLVKFPNWATKEQDDMSEKFIDDIMKEVDNL